jgi:signal transduction histidine kinase
VDGVTVSYDRDRLLQVLSNLLGNAIKFCASGDSVTLHAEARDDDVFVSVADTGPGIPHEQLASIFEAYRTANRRGSSGTGLGLFIAKGIIERHGGRISVQSEPGAGATFSFTLPRV